MRKLSVKTLKSKAENKEDKIEEKQQPEEIIKTEINNKKKKKHQKNKKIKMHLQIHKIKEVSFFLI